VKEDYKQIVTQLQVSKVPNNGQMIKKKEKNGNKMVTCQMFVLFLPLVVNKDKYKYKFNNWHQR